MKASESSTKLSGVKRSGFRQAYSLMNLHNRFSPSPSSLRKGKAHRTTESLVYKRLLLENLYFEFSREINRFIRISIGFIENRSHEFVGIGASGGVRREHGRI